MAGPAPFKATPTGSSQPGSRYNFLQPTRFKTYLLENHLGSIKTTDICCCVCFSITQLLSLLKCTFKSRSILHHFAQYIVSSTVYNDHNFNNTVSCQALLKRSNNWNTTCYTGFKKITFEGSRGKFFLLPYASGDYPWHLGLFAGYGLITLPAARKC